MPKVNPKALLELDEVRTAIETAKAKGPLEAALFAWMYEFGARAAEPGLQRLEDIDLRAKRARVIHLKSSSAVVRGRVQGQEWDSMLPLCQELLPPWLKVRPSHVLEPGQKLYLFPSRFPGGCTTCKGSGKRPAMRERIWTTTHCHHCGGTGKRWGLSRHEVYHIVTGLLKDAGVALGHRHPHTLRHSLITHLLEGDVPAGAIQERVGHRFIATTLSYVRATKAARVKLEGALSGLYSKDKTDDEGK